MCVRVRERERERDARQSFPNSSNHNETDGSARRTMLLATTAIGSALCIAVLAFYESHQYWGNALLMIFSNLAFGSAVIFYNAYLPLLVAASEDVVDLLEDESSTAEEISVKIDETTSQISSYGPAFGYIGQGIMLMVNLVIFAMMSDATLATQVCEERSDASAIRLPGSEMLSCALFCPPLSGHSSNSGSLTLLSPTNPTPQINCAISGTWTLLFGVLSWSRLKDRPGPDLPDGEGYFSQGVKDVSQTIMHLKADLPNLGKFLTAYFIYSDGTSTMTSAASQFAGYELNMNMTQILLGLLEISFLAPLGCLFWLYVQNSCAIKPKTIINILLVIFLGMTVYGYIALREQVEFYILCAVYAFVAGAEQAFTRGLYSEMIPKGHESEFFSFYEVTDKGTAWLGPLVVGIVNDQTGSMRNAIMAIGAFFAIGLILLQRVDVDAAIAEKHDFEEHHQVTAKERLSLAAR